MPGKVNPTQAEAMLMVTIQVIGNDTTIAIAGKEGNFELNTFRPVIIANLLHGMRILGDVCDRFRRFMIEGIELDEGRITESVDRSVMLVTALSPVIGYEQASSIAHLAMVEDLTLRDGGAAVRRGRRAVRPGHRPARHDETRRRRADLTGAATRLRSAAASESVTVSRTVGRSDEQAAQRSSPSCCWSPGW